MIAKVHLHVILLVAAILWGTLLFVDGVAVKISWLRYFSVVAGIMVALLAAFDLFLWRLPLLQGWFIKRPDLRGTWRATFRSNWRDAKAEEQLPPTDAYAVITQTFSSLSFRLMTVESTSELLGAQLIPSMDGSYRLLGVYRNEPRLSVREKSAIHNGAILLEVSRAPVARMRGHYWTDRNTAGEIELIERLPEQYADFEAARDAFCGNQKIANFSSL